IKVTSACIPLPVVMAYFNVVKQGSGALLSWATVTEQNSSHFIIEKSLDGVAFTPIGKVDVRGNSFSPVTYGFTDPFIGLGITYYRLVQYDIDGTAHYSEIKSVSNGGRMDVQISPNPNNGVFVVAL